MKPKLPNNKIFGVSQGTEAQLHFSQFLFLFIVIFFNSFIYIYPQKAKIAFEHFTPEQGMSSYIAPCIIQDKEGYLWFGTYDGIDRYDGNIFTSYKNEPGNKSSINSGSVQAICEDRAGNLWIGTSLGLEKLDRSTGKFTHLFPHPPTTGIDFSNYILSICEDKFGVLWVGTANGLNKFDKVSGKFSCFRQDRMDPGSISNDYVHAILEDNEGNLWIGTGNGLDRLDRTTGKFVHYWHDPKNQIGSIRIEWNNSIEYSLTHQINSIYEDNNGLLWLCTNGEGLIAFNLKEKFYKTFKHNTDDPLSKNCLTSDYIVSIAQDSDGVYWVGTKFNGLNTFNKEQNKFTHYYHDDYDPKSLSIDMILAIHLERSGTIWISSFTGLNKINRKERLFTQYNNFESSWDNTFGSSAIIANSDNNSLWIEAGNEILKFYPPSGTFVSQFSIQSVGATYIAGDNSGNIWMKHFTGGLSLKEMDGKETRIQYSSGKEFNQQVYCLYSPPSSDTVWIGTLEGDLLSISKKTKTTSFIKSIRTSIKCIYKDSFGILWAGTKDAGLFQYNESERELVLFKSNVNDLGSITSNFITTIHEDKKGNVWFGTNIGLNKYNRSTQSFIHFTEKEGLPNNLIFAIEEDAHGNLWFSTDNGISKLNPETREIKNYDISYGFTTNRFYFTGCKTETGEIYFGGPGGLTRFHPDSIKDNPYIPPIVITSFRIFDKPIPFSNKTELDYDKNFLSFEFASLSYLSPQRNQYAYKMEGVDKDWIYSGTRRYASYTNMEPGEYIFRVKGSNNDGVWNEEGTSIAISIMPPFWKTWWAYLSYAGIFIFALFGIRRYEMNRISYKNQTKLDKVVLIEKEETEKLKSRFFANISHEFRTPLTLILGPAEKIISNTSDDIIKDANIIKRNSRRLLQLINQLLDLSKLESGKLKLEASKGNIVSFVTGVVLSFESLAESKDINLKLLSEKDFIELYFDREKMMKILTNILSNSFKFTPLQGIITVSIKLSSNSPSSKLGYKSGSLEIKIRDTGIGIPQNELPKLFDRFYQVDNSFTKEHEGTGIGLALTKELVELHYGNISVESIMDNQDKSGTSWTEFTVTLPLGSSHLKNDEIIKTENAEDSLLHIEEGRYTSPLSKPDTDLITMSINDEVIKDQSEEKTIVLVVEDNYEMREYIKESLDKSYHIEEAVNGEQGVMKAEKIIPDLIISDMMMPKMDGNELTRILKNDEKTSHIPIILLTARSGQENKIEGLEMGADDYLTKPFDIKELRVRIENLIKIRRTLQTKYSRLEFATKAEGKKALSLDEKFLNKVEEVIEQHISKEEFNMEDFSREVAMSRAQLHRKLKALTGKSATLYIRTVKLLKAKKMIEHNTGTISEIAYSLGFSSPTYFTRCFKEEFGYPPSEITKL